MASEPENRHEEKLQSLIAEYLEAVDAGEPTDADELIARNPELADELREFFADQKEIERLAQPSPSELDPTLDSKNLDQPLQIEPTIGVTSEATGVKGTSALDNPHSRKRVGYFGDYELIDEIARGGMGVVYKARQVNLDRVVALKMILSGQLASKDDVQRFHQEAEAAANLHHPGIVPIHEIGEHSGQHFFSMAFVDGPSLAGLLADGPLPPREAAQIVQQVAEAIAYSHSRGVIHRDLKPANILLARHDDRGVAGRKSAIKISSTPEHPDRAGIYEPKVTDFGLAKRTESASEMTGTGQILGTPSYMPPEQASGKTKEIGVAADVYSLGAILYAALTGRPPFQAANPLDTLMQVIKNEPLPPRQFNPQTPKDLETICLKCLQKEPHKRYESAQALADELDRWLEDKPILARPVGRVERAVKLVRRHPVVSGLVTAVVVALIAGTVVSSFFAVRARLAAEAERLARQVAEQNEAKANVLAHEKTALAGEMAFLAEEKAELATAEQSARVEQERLREIAVHDRDQALQSLYLADIRQARQSIRDGEFGEVNRILRLHGPGIDQPDPRGWEWYYLLAQSERDVTTQSNLAWGISHVTWSPDGRWLATCGNGKVIRIYSADEFRLHATWNVDATVSRISWSPDSESVALSLNNGSVQAWRIANQSMTFAVHGARADWSPDGRKLACLADGILIYDAESGDALKTVKGGVGFEVVADIGFKGLVWNPDSRRIAGLSAWSGRVFDVETGEPIADVKYPNAGGYLTSGCAWSPDGKELAFGYGYGVFYVCVWNSENKKTRWYDGHFDIVVDVAWSSDGKQIASASNDRRIQIRDSQTGEVSTTITGHSSHVRQLAWHPANDLMISVSGDGQLGVWRLGHSPSPSREFRGGQEVTSLSWDSTRNMLASTEPGMTRIWDTANGTEIHTIERKSGGQDVAAWCPHGDKIAIAAKADGSSIEHLQIWNSSSPKPLFSLPTARRIWGVDWSPDGKYVVGVGAYHDANVYDTDTQQLVWTIPLTRPKSGYLVGVSWSPDGKRIAFCEERRPSSVWDFESRSKLGDLQYSGNGWALSWSPDCRHIALASKTGMIDIVDSITGTRVLQLRGHRGMVRSVDWSPDGRRIASASNDRSVRVWDAKTGEEILNFQGHTAPTSAVAWRPNNEELASADEQGVIRIWDARNGYAGARKRVIPWWVVGTFPDDDSPNHAPLTPVDPTKPVAHPDGMPMHWRRLTTGFDSKVDLNAAFATPPVTERPNSASGIRVKTETNNCSAYAQTFIYSPRDQSVEFWLGHDDGAQLWLNGVEIYRHNSGYRGYPDAHRLPVDCRAGWNRLVARVWNATGAFALYLRVAGSDQNQELQGIRFSHFPNAEALPKIGEPSPFSEETISPDRELAELATRLDLVVEVNGQAVAAMSDLPENEFFVTAMDLSSQPRVAAFVIPRLAELKQLRSLKLAAINDYSAAELKKVTSLKRLALTDAEISDAAIPTLASLAELKSIDLTGTLITADGIQALQDALPDLSVEWNAFEQDRAAAKWVLVFGGKLKIFTPAGIKAVTSSDELPAYPFRVAEIDLSDLAQVQNVDLARLEELTALESLSLFGTGLTDEGMKHLRKLTKLKSLHIGKTKVSGEGLSHLAGMTELRNLNCSHSPPLTNEGLSHLPKLPSLVYWGGDLRAPVSDEALVYFQRLPALEHLGIWGSDLTGEGIQHLSGLPRLRKLALRSSRLQNDYLIRLKSFANLQDLDLAHFSNLTIEGAKHLAEVESLKRLSLANSNLTDDGLLALTDMKNLTYLNIKGASITPAGVARFKKTLPSCEVAY